MKKSLIAAALLAGTSTCALAQTASGVGAAVSLPDVVLNPSTPFNPYAGAYNGPIAETTNITGVNKPIIEVPRAAFVVTPQTLQQQMPQSLAEALQTVPGTFIGNTNGGNSDYITIRGFEVDSQDFVALGNGDGILIDEVRSPIDRAFNANTQTVSLLSGPASLLYGNGNVGGVIDIQRKLPLPETHAAVSALGGAVGGKFRSIAGTFDITGPIYKSTEGLFAYRLVGSTAGAEPWRKGDTTTRDFLMAPTLAFYSDRLTATVAYEHDRNQQPYDRGDTSTGYYTSAVRSPTVNNFVATAPLQISRFISYSEPISQYNENVDWVHSKISYKITPNTDFTLWSSYAGTAVAINEVRSDNQTDINPFTGQILNNGTTRNQRFLLNTPTDVGVQQYEIRALIDRRDQFGPFKNDLQIGAEYYNFRNEEPNSIFHYYGTNQAFNLFAPNYGFVNPTGPVSDNIKSGFFLRNANNALVNLSYGSLPYEAQKQRDTSFFFQEGVSYGPLTVQGGGRATSIFNYLRQGSVNPNANSTENAFLPSGQLLYLINRDSSLYASYSQSYQANVFSPGATPLNVGFVGTDVPQRGEGYEAGIKSKFFNGRVLAQASAFRIDKQHVQVMNQQGLISFSQAQRSEGGEFSVAGYVTPNLEINVNYSHQTVYVTNDTPNNADIGFRVVNAPANTFAAYAYYHFLDGFFNHLTVNAGVFGASSNVVNSANTYALPGFAVVSTGFAYEYQRTLSSPKYVLSFKINNLADTTYYPSTGSKTNWITVGEPRNFLLGLSAAI